MKNLIPQIDLDKMKEIDALRLKQAAKDFNLDLDNITLDFKEAFFSDKMLLLLEMEA